MLSGSCLHHATLPRLSMAANRFQQPRLVKCMCVCIALMSLPLFSMADACSSTWLVTSGVSDAYFGLMLSRTSAMHVSEVPMFV